VEPPAATLVVRISTAIALTVFPGVGNATP
jgi:hypothetical protein